jgi:transposase
LRIFSAAVADTASISDVAKELALDWHRVKALEMQYMKAQLARAGTPGPLAIRIDEIAIREGRRGMA